MRIREIEFHNFRSFRGKRQISFVDPLTGAVRPVTVIAGKNGTGKTTILEAIEALLRLVVGRSRAERVFDDQALEAGLVHMQLEVNHTDSALFPDDPDFSEGLPFAEVIHIAAGRHDLVPTALDADWPQHACYLVHLDPERSIAFRDTHLVRALLDSTALMDNRAIPLHGGLIAFPNGRQLVCGIQGGSIEPPQQGFQWITRYSFENRWQGSLEQLWVWQNYLDLEQGAQQREHLQPFVATVENLLGADRPIMVQQGRVQVPASWSGDGSTAGAMLHLDQLPSGEQQVLLLFGELARRRRRGAVLLIDEPETSLHPGLQRHMLRQLRAFIQEWDMQLIIATHSLEILSMVSESERIILDDLTDQESDFYTV